MAAQRLALRAALLLGSALLTAAWEAAACAEDGPAGACVRGDEASMMQLKRTQAELEQESSWPNPRRGAKRPRGRHLRPRPPPDEDRNTTSTPVTAATASSLLEKGEEGGVRRRRSSLGGWPGGCRRRRSEKVKEGLIKIDEDGVVNEYYLPGATTVDDHTAVEYTPPYRFYLMKRYTLNYSDPEDFYKPPLIGKTFSVDFSFGPEPASCGCNINFYLVDMPVKEPGRDNDYYCDAQCYEGIGCCVEFDMNEGSGAAQAVTNHACNPPYPDQPDWECNRWGAPSNKTKDEDFGPGDHHYINSKRNFTYTQRFDLDTQGNLLVTTVIIQGANVWSKQMGPSSELQAILPFFEEGMAFVTGYWNSPDMGWLDSSSSACNYTAETPYLYCNNNTVVISNWRITTNASPIPTTTTTTTAPSMCCWSDSRECDWTCQAPDTWPDDWCHQSEENCEVCTGTFCPYPAPPPPDEALRAQEGASPVSAAADQA